MCRVEVCIEVCIEVTMCEVAMHEVTTIHRAGSNV